MNIYSDFDTPRFYLAKRDLDRLPGSDRMGFSAARLEGVPLPPLPKCKRCGEPIPRATDGHAYCEFEYGPVDPNRPPDCKCSWCVIRTRGGERGRGRPPEFCTLNDECQRERKRAKQREYRQRRKAAKYAA